MKVDFRVRSHLVTTTQTVYVVSITFEICCMVTKSTVHTWRQKKNNKKNTSLSSSANGPSTGYPPPIVNKSNLQMNISTRCITFVSGDTSAVFFLNLLFFVSFFWKNNQKETIESASHRYLFRHFVICCCEIFIVLQTFMRSRDDKINRISVCLSCVRSVNLLGAR